MGTQSIVLNMKHEEQALKEQMAWHEANGHFKSDRDRQAFEAGYRQGWGACRNNAMLHGTCHPEREKEITFPINGV